MPFWKYYLDVNLFNLLLAVVVGIYALLNWAFIIFCSIGLGIDLLIYKLTKNNHYLYYNLGWTKTKLFGMMPLFNLLASFLLLTCFSVLQWMCLI